MANANGPLRGLKVLDLSIIVAGGTASNLLADFGAEVVIVERPGNTDLLRNWMLGIVPKFSDTPGSVAYAGPRLGEHSYQVCRSWLGYSDGEIDAVARRGII